MVAAGMEVVAALTAAASAASALPPHRPSCWWRRRERRWRGRRWLLQDRRKVNGACVHTSVALSQLSPLFLFFLAGTPPLLRRSTGCQRCGGRAG